MVFTLHVSHCLNISKQMRSTKTLAPLFTFSSIEFTTNHSSAFLRGRSNFFDWSTASRRGVGCTLTPRHSLRAQSLTMMTELQSCLTDCETDPSPAMKKHLFHLSHLLDYFSQIERCLETSSSPAMEFRHCYAYGGRDSKTFFKSAGSTMAKPMMRTLIYGGLPMEGNFVKNDSNDANPDCPLTTKTQFDQLIRDVRSSIEFQRMHHFIVEELQPAVLSMDKEDRVNLIPDALKRIEEIARYLSPSVCNADDATERISPAKSAFLKPPKGWFNLLSRIASGRNYRGKLNKLIYDLFPQLVDKYNEASRKSTEREIFEQIIITELVNKASEDSDEWTRRRIYAAWKCLDHYFPENSVSNEKDTTTNIPKQKNHPQETGKRCEKSCTSFLYEASLQEIYKNNKSNENCCRSRRIILENVYVNTRRSSMYSTSSSICSVNPDAQQTLPPEIQAQKYKPPKPHRNGSGIIWTNYSESNGTSRHGICSEFDNVVIIEKINMSGKSGNLNNSNEISLESIWEAKRTISPSTLHDVLTKKLSAVEALMDDRSTELAYMDNDDNMASLLLFPNVEAANITFGVYGTELLPPENAADSIRSVATSNIISSDLNEVVKALERGGEVIMIEVDIERTLNIIRGLRKLVEEKIESEERIQVLLLLERDVDFLCN